MNSEEIKSLFQSFSNIKVGVIGDVMLDTYWWGKVDRISPEAPVPVVAVSKREQRIGGAGNVALNLQSLGAQVHILSVLGADAEGAEVASLMSNQQIHTNYLLNSDHRITTNKIRIISKNQHMLRLDAEITHPLDSQDEQLLIEQFSKYLQKEKPHIVILEDYNKGVLSEGVIEAVIALCKQQHVFTAVDPKRKHFFAYKGVDIFKPNLHEAKEGLNMVGDEVNIEVLNTIHKALFTQLQHATSLITLSEKGVYYQTQNAAELIPTHIRTIADVSGAGDSVIAVAAIVFAATQNVKLMAEIANIAGGLVCEEVGTVAINKERLLQECQAILAK